MRNIIINIVSLFNRLFLNIIHRKYNIFTGTFFLARIKINSCSKVNIENSEILKTYIDLQGRENFIRCNNATLSNSSITISGVNNQLHIENNVKLNNTIIIIRGKGCQVRIGEGTTSGGMRIINVGFNNRVEIGKNCLFSDNIELWSSDTHTIYDEHKECINIDKSIYINDHVWIGSRVIILKGVTINNGSVVGMGSIVTKDVPSNVVSAGIPSKVLKEKISWSLEHESDKFLK